MAARWQMAVSLGSHIVLSCFGVALPAMIFVVHRRGLRRGDDAALDLAHKWAKAAAVLFAVGAVSGTILSFEMGLLWPRLMSQFGDVLGLPFALEGIAFFVEAIFMGIYLYGWGRLPARLHLYTLVPMIAAGVFGTFCVLAVNAWMNAPSGFTIAADGTVTDVDPLAAMFNGAVWQQFIHMFVACYLVTGFLTAAVYAVGMLRGRRDEQHRLGFLVPFTFAGVAAVLQPFTGHFAGMRLYSRPAEQVGGDGVGDDVRRGRAAAARRSPRRRRGALGGPDPAARFAPARARGSAASCRASTSSPSRTGRRRPSSTSPSRR